MSDPSLSDSKQNPDQPVVSSDQAQPLTSTHISGSSRLDAHAETAGNQPQGEPGDNAIATNFSEASTPGDTKTAGASGVRSPYSHDQKSSQGQVNLQNNPGVPDQEMQGTLPHTDPVERPIDRDANLQE